MRLVWNLLILEAIIRSMVNSLKCLNWLDSLYRTCLRSFSSFFKAYFSFDIFNNKSIWDENIYFLRHPFTYKHFFWYLFIFIYNKMKKAKNKLPKDTSFHLPKLPYLPSNSTLNYSHKIDSAITKRFKT